MVRRHHTHTTREAGREDKKDGREDEGLTADTTGASFLYSDRTKKTSPRGRCRRRHATASAV